MQRFFTCGLKLLFRLNKRIDLFAQLAILNAKVAAPAGLLDQPTSQHMSTLLEKAKSVPKPISIVSKEEITDEHIELITAYFDGVITTRQASFALGHNHPGNFTAWLGEMVKLLYRQNKIQFIK